MIEQFLLAGAVKFLREEPLRRRALGKGYWDTSVGRYESAGGATVRWCAEQVLKINKQRGERV